MTGRPQLVLLHAAAEAVSGARECGIGWASVRGTVHTGAIGYYTSQAAKAGMAAVGVVAGVPNGLRRRPRRRRRDQPALGDGARGASR